MHLLFVCHGNICRSTMAESVMAHLLKEAHLEQAVTVDSAATSTEEIGNPPHYGTRNELARRGVPLRPHRAKRITPQDAILADVILAMDHANVRNLKRILPEAEHHKIRLLLSFAGREAEIADPWYTDAFDITYEDVLDGCLGLLKWLPKDCK
jgi:protein-tyrosine phosphatase